MRFTEAEVERVLRRLLRARKGPTWSDVFQRLGLVWRYAVRHDGTRDVCSLIADDFRRDL
jgi:hypothetical protein